MKKLKKVFGVFSVALLLMSMSNNAVVIKKDTCTLLAQTAFNYAVNVEDADFATAVAYANIVYNNCNKTVSIVAAP